MQDVHTDGNRIAFTTSTGTRTPEGKIYIDVHKYKGIMTGNTIQFSMLTDSQVDTHSMIHFTVTRIARKNAPK